MDVESVGADWDNGTGCKEMFGDSEGRDAVAAPTVIDRPSDMRRSGGSDAQFTVCGGSCSLPRFDREELRDFPVELDADCRCERDSELEVEEKSRNEYNRLVRVGDGGSGGSDDSLRTTGGCC